MVRSQSVFIIHPAESTHFIQPDFPEREKIYCYYITVLFYPQYIIISKQPKLISFHYINCITVDCWMMINYYN